MGSGELFVLIIIAMGMKCGPGIWFFYSNIEERKKNRVREIYKELVLAKLDVIKTALAMGKSDDEIAELDKRLEKLIGSEKMLKTLKTGEETIELADSDLQSTDLEAELLRQQRDATKAKDLHSNSAR